MKCPTTIVYRKIREYDGVCTSIHRCGAHSNRGQRATLGSMNSHSTGVMSEEIRAGVHIFDQNNSHEQLLYEKKKSLRVHRSNVLRPIFSQRPKRRARISDQALDLKRQLRQRCVQNLSRHRSRTDIVFLSSSGKWLKHLTGKLLLKCVRSLQTSDVPRRWRTIHQKVACAYLRQQESLNGPDRIRLFEIVP